MSKLVIVAKHISINALIEEYEPTLANSEEGNVAGNIVTSDQFLNYIYDNIFDVAESEEEAIVRIAMYIDGFDMSMRDGSIVSFSGDNGGCSMLRIVGNSGD